jgi:hypothetical protein
VPELCHTVLAAGSSCMCGTPTHTPPSSHVVWQHLTLIDWLGLVVMPPSTVMSRSCVSVSVSISRLAPMPMYVVCCLLFISLVLRGIQQLLIQSHRPTLPATIIGHLHTSLLRYCSCCCCSLWQHFLFRMLLQQNATRQSTTATCLLPVLFQCESADNGAIGLVRRDLRGTRRNLCDAYTGVAKGLGCLDIAPPCHCHRHALSHSMGQTQLQGCI